MQEVPLKKVYIQEYLRLLQEAQKMTKNEFLDETQTEKVSYIDYHSPVKAKFMRKNFIILGSVWSDIGKPNTDLNMMLSNPLFRHKEDSDKDKIDQNVEERRSRSTNDSESDEDAAIRASVENQANDDTLFDMSRLILFAVLYCKGSRIGKSNMLFPLIMRQVP